MDNRKWLKRKYPETFEEANNFFNDGLLNEFKLGKYKLGRLIKDVYFDEHLTYKKDALIVWKRNKSYWEGKWDGLFDLYTIIKCKKGFTTSGYHSIHITENELEEIKL